MKPYYQDSAVTIYHGDCREILPHLEPVDLVLTDPPYGTHLYASDLEVLTPELFTCWPKSAIFGWPERLIAFSLAIGRVPDEWITWWPSNAALRTLGTGGGIARETECIAVFGKADWSKCREPRSFNSKRLQSKPYRGRNNRIGSWSQGEPESRLLGDVWRDASPGLGFQSHRRLHPNEKPLSLLRRLIGALSDGQILDPFMGSGTTLRAAKDLGLKAIGIEIEERYCEIAANRMSQEVLQFSEVRTVQYGT